MPAAPFHLPSDGDPLPVDGVIYIVIDDGKTVEVAYCDQTKYWTGAEVWSRLDGESGSWAAEEICGWSYDADVALEGAPAAVALWLTVA